MQNLANTEVSLSEALSLVEQRDEDIAVLDSEFKLIAANRTFLGRFSSIELSAFWGRSILDCSSINIPWLTKESLQILAESLGRINKNHTSESLQLSPPDFKASGSDESVTTDLTWVITNTAIMGENEAIQFVLLRVQNISTLSDEKSKYLAIGEVAAGIAHEIFNPLAVISGLNEQIRIHVNRPAIAKEAIVEATKKIDKMLVRITKTIQGIRALTRESSSATFENVNVRELVIDTVEICRNSFRELNIAIEIEEIPADLVVRGHVNQLSQVLLNLILNSQHAVQNQEEKWVKIEALRDTKDVIIAVLDSGKGIPLEIRNKIFSKIFTTKKNGEGTGLGLRLSKRIIERQHGTLEIDDSRKNTCFKICLPGDRA